MGGATRKRGYLINILIFKIILIEKRSNGRLNFFLFNLILTNLMILKKILVIKMKKNIVEFKLSVVLKTIN